MLAEQAERLGVGFWAWSIGGILWLIVLPIIGAVEVVSWLISLIG